MIFITLQKFRKKATKEFLAQNTKVMEEAKKQGVKVLGLYWTLSRYDVIAIWEAPDKGAIQAAMKTAIGAGDVLSSETLVALPREEAVKLVE
jgi:uncharacterized protein with GYD domain